MAGVGRFQDLVAWQLAYQLRRRTIPLLHRTRKVKDFKLHDQLREAARSAPRNIAEGFGRFKHKDFAKFARIAKGSELELLNGFVEACAEGYISAREFDELEHAARKALKALNGLIRYLDSTPDVN